MKLVRWIPFDDHCDNDDNLDDNCGDDDDDDDDRDGEEGTLAWEQARGWDCCRSCCLLQSFADPAVTEVNII